MNSALQTYYSNTVHILTMLLGNSVSEHQSLSVRCNA